MAEGRRPRQVAELLQAEVARLLPTLRDPGLGFVTVTGVRLSPDLREARVFVSVLESSQEEAAVAALNRASGFLRRSLSRRIYLKQLPRLTFCADPSIREGARMDGLLEGLRPPAGEEE